MTIDRKFEVITFWETMTNEKYELRGRIKREEIDGSGQKTDEKELLETFLYNTDKEVQDDNIFLRKFKDLSTFLIKKYIFFINFFFFYNFFS